jgi:hypothetical protein
VAWVAYGEGGVNDMEVAEKARFRLRMDTVLHTAQDPVASIPHSDPVVAACSDNSDPVVVAGFVVDFPIVVAFCSFFEHCFLVKKKTMPWRQFSSWVLVHVEPHLFRRWLNHEHSRMKHLPGFRFVGFQIHL